MRCVQWCYHGLSIPITVFESVSVHPSPQFPETLQAEKESTTAWTRLYKTPTLASARRDVTHFDPQVTARMHEATAK